MAGSPDRILATHVGSLVRPPKLVEFLKLIEAGQPYDKAAYRGLPEEFDRRGRAPAGRGRHRHRQRRRVQQGPQLGLLHPRPDQRHHDAAGDAGGDEGPAVLGRRRPGPRGVSRILCRIRPRLGPRRAARQPLRRQRPAHLQRRRGERDIATLKAAAAKANATGAFLPVVAPASALPGAKNEHYATRRASCSRSPTACTRNTRRSSTPVSMCRSTTPSCPTCTSGWCRR